MSASRWVVGVDGSAGAEQAIGWAATHAGGRASEIDVVHAWHVSDIGPAPELSPTLLAQDEPDGQAMAAMHVAERAAEFARSITDVRVEASAVHGLTSSTLIDAAENADALVIGRRGLGGFARLLVGSTSIQCATHAGVPTIIVPNEAKIEPATDVTVGVDGSPNSVAALQWALQFAAPGSVVRVVMVWDTSPLAVGADQFFFPEANELAQQRFDHLIDDVEASTAHPDSVVLERCFVDGKPRQALLEACSNSDLLVVGARGHGALASALIGSVSTSLLHNGTIATVVVPLTSTLPS